METMERPISVQQLLDETHHSCNKSGELLNIVGPEGHDVYNITQPFSFEGKTYIIGRTEEPQDQFYSKAIFYFHDPEASMWRQDVSIPTYSLQDPFVTIIKDEIVLGGVKVHYNPDDPREKVTCDTELYRGKDLRDMSLFATIPGMKDVRLAANPNGGLELLTRPQGKIGGRGKIGHITLGNLGEINKDVANQAELLNLFDHERREWGGANWATVTQEGLVRILGHIARFNGYNEESGEHNREYYGMTFVLNPKTKEVTDQQIFACRKCFPETGAKRADLRKVVFVGGAVMTANAYVVYAGLSDKAAGRVTIPFS